MGFTEIITLITGVLQFPKAILELVNMLKKTPQQKHEELLTRIRDEADKFEKTGRPTW